MNQINKFKFWVFIFLVIPFNNVSAQLDSSYHFVYVNIGSMQGGANLTTKLDSLYQSFEREKSFAIFFLSNQKNPDIFFGKGDYESWLGSVSSIEPSPSNPTIDLDSIIGIIQKKEICSFRNGAISSNFRSINFHFFLTGKEYFALKYHKYLVDKLFISLNTSKFDQKININFYFPFVDAKEYYSFNQIIQFNSKRNVKANCNFF